jgi:hypothetical protein
VKLKREVIELILRQRKSVDELIIHSREVLLISEDDTGVATRLNREDPRLKRVGGYGLYERRVYLTPSGVFIGLTSIRLRDHTTQAKLTPALFIFTYALYDLFGREAE